MIQITVVFHHFSGKVFNDYKREYRDLGDVFRQIFKKSNIQMILYSGDTDIIVNFIGTQWFMRDLNRTLLSERQPWYVDGQVAGFKDVYDRISFYSVKVCQIIGYYMKMLQLFYLQGAGHMVPEGAPKFAYDMFNRFIGQNK